MSLEEDRNRQLNPSLLSDIVCGSSSLCLLASCLYPQLFGRVFAFHRRLDGREFEMLCILIFVVGGILAKLCRRSAGDC